MRPTQEWRPPQLSRLASSATLAWRRRALARHLKVKVTQCSSVGRSVRTLRQVVRGRLLQVRRCHCPLRFGGCTTFLSEFLTTRPHPCPWPRAQWSQTACPCGMGLNLPLEPPSSRLSPGQGNPTRVPTPSQCVLEPAPRHSPVRWRKSVREKRRASAFSATRRHRLRPVRGSAARRKKTSLLREGGGRGRHAAATCHPHEPAMSQQPELQRRAADADAGFQRGLRNDERAFVCFPRSIPV